MFNPEARWDRPLPRDETPLGEPIEAGAAFKNGRFLPAWFVSGGRRHTVKKIEFIWKERKGRELMYFFSVTDEHGGLYRLCFRSGNLTWRMLAADT